nr:hypothetical protein [Hyphomonas sp. Mor2]
MKLVFTVLAWMALFPYGAADGLPRDYDFFGDNHCVVQDARAIPHRGEIYAGSIEVMTQHFKLTMVESGVRGLSLQVERFDERVSDSYESANGEESFHSDTGAGFVWLSGAKAEANFITVAGDSELDDLFYVIFRAKCSKATS